MDLNAEEYLGKGIRECLLTDAIAICALLLNLTLKKLFEEVLDAVNGDPHNSASPNDGDAKKQQKTAAFRDVL